jgi:uncharacterized membrane protein
MVLLLKKFSERSKFMNKKTKYLTHASVIAALYVALTYLAMSLGLDKNAIQIRFSEALCALAFITPAAVPGITVGCFIANLLTGCAPLDIFLGPVATLIGAMGAYLCGKLKNKRIAKWLWSIPNILANTVIVTIVCYFCYTAPGEQTLAIIPFYATTIFIGEVISCGVLGSILLVSAEKPLRRFL